MNKWTQQFLAHARSRRMQVSAALIAVFASLSLVPAASASKGQVALIQDGLALKQDPAGTMNQFRELGATTVRVLVFWKDVVPSPNAKKAPKGFKPTNPASYDQGGWQQYDNIVTEAKKEGLTVDIDLTGPPPRWAQGKGVSNHALKSRFGWRPNSRMYGQFAAAAAKRYDGSFKPKGDSKALPKVSIWSLWNEPNFGQDLGPQATGANSHFTGYDVAAGYYRNLVRTGYHSLKADKRLRGSKILIGELAGQGRSFVKTRKFPQGLPGNYAITWPNWFLQTLYCVNTHYQRLTGKAAKMAGCPTSARAARSFRKHNPGLFSATAVASHPYASTFKPNATKGISPNAIILPVINRLETEMRKLSGHYGARRNWPIWNTEYGFITSPPQKKGQHYPSPGTAAMYLNEAEFLSYRNRNLASYAQYLLKDPPTLKGVGLFASGLRTDKGKQKPAFNAYRMPLWMPHQSVKRGSRAEVWGGARPVHFANVRTAAQKVRIQLKAGKGAWKTLATVTPAKSNGYFDAHVKISQGGRLRLQYTYPSNEPFLPMSTSGKTIVSRTVNVKVH